ncbi:MAG: copper resistance protein CopC, partial [Actinomycetota bacterium]|nr:copper resistance protein CopC [Actinomycetota bacterium]
IDGCGDDVVTDIQRDDRTVRLALATGQPGRWRVEYRVISALDGHLVRGDFAFRVAGERDCTAAGDGDETPPAGGTADDDEIVGPGLQMPDDGGTGPLVPMLAIGGGIVLAAFVIRKMTHR